MRAALSVAKTFLIPPLFLAALVLMLFAIVFYALGDLFEKMMGYFRELMIEMIDA